MLPNCFKNYSFAHNFGQSFDEPSLLLYLYRIFLFDSMINCFVFRNAESVQGLLYFEPKKKITRFPLKMNKNTANLVLIWRFRWIVQFQHFTNLYCVLIVFTMTTKTITMNNFCRSVQPNATFQQNYKLLNQKDNLAICFEFDHK